MFCYQCEQAPDKNGCTDGGKCGKTKDAAALQDLLVALCKDIARYAVFAKRERKPTNVADKFVIKALTATLNNANFDTGEIWALIQQAYLKKEEIKKICKKKNEDDIANPSSIRDAIEYAPEVSILEVSKDKGKAVTDLQEFLIYCVKGIAGFAYKARKLGGKNQDVYDFINKALAYTRQEEVVIKKLFKMITDSGKYTLKAAETLYSAIEENYGVPSPIKIKARKIPGKCMLVAGNDLKTLEVVLEQTQGKDINVYTHGELLTAHSYPKLNKHKHLVGHYGTSWLKQQEEFKDFPGAIIITGNTLKEPHATYRNKVFTTGLTRWQAGNHIENRDFTPAIEYAQSANGYPELEEEEQEKLDKQAKSYFVGFGHKSLVSIADVFSKMVKLKKISRFIVIGGSDGNELRGSYLYQAAKRTPEDWLILTYGSAKYRLLEADLGTILGFPRVVDVGGLNDFYSVIRFLSSMAKASQTDIKGLPTSMVFSWCDPQSVAIMMALLYMGVENIRLAPTMPAFIPKEIWKTLSKKYNISMVKRAEDDVLHMSGEY